ncbi:pyridoxamine 5'-phosphate oxidase family protein [Kibdelosporangium philippinense]|uniref:Pyridoxamine 5'-phosphate oxidase family protein n=1 Tax=Kibdelosporangium philippinense TaxID=211113 RepID=A0ABS8ZB12_9PSEU|nr:pyridoxamine 5'-phosphate oxidase family protein [Kibdelosporangium philippinense]MCE7004682.1 pyridoxamine 5'-phosphate oxidase family protein [Kibdelosporangium philippinense]
MVDGAGLEVLNEAECLQLLAGAPVGRIVFSDRALPAVLPVNFAVIENAVIIRTDARSRLAIAGTNTVVAFEADEFSSRPSRSAWSVVAVGMATEVSVPADLDAIRRLGLHPWASGAKEYYLRMDIETITGRRLHASG